MKKLLFVLFTLTLLATLSVQAQTVRTAINGYDGGTYTADQLRTGMLIDRTYLELTGTWTPQQIDSLSASLHTQFKPSTFQISSNDALQGIIMRDAVFSGDSISFAATFFSCSKLVNVVLPSTKFNGKVNLSMAFALCPKLYEVVNLDQMPQICDLSATFNGCSKQLESLRFSGTLNNNNVNFTSAFKDCSSLQSIENLDAFVRITSLTSTFDGCESLTEIRFFPSMKYFNEEYFFMSTFRGCRKLTKIENLDCFVNMRTSSPIYMTETFKDCEKLDSIRLRPDGSHLINLRAAFSGCRKLRKFNSGDLVFTNLSGTFRNCENLEEFVCHPNSADHDKLVDMGDAFSGCRKLKIPSSSPICYKRIYGIDSCFYNCSSLEVVTFTQPQGLWMPAWSMFEGCSNLEYVYGFENFTDLNSLRHTFKDCYKLKEVHLGTDPNSLATYDIEDTFGTALSSPNYTTQSPYNIKLYEVRDAASCIKFLPDGVTTVPTKWINANYNNFVVPLTVTSSLSDLTVYEGDHLYSKIQGVTFTVSPEYAYRDSLYWEIVEYGNWERIEDIWHFRFNRIHDRGQLAFYVENKKGYYGKTINLTVNPIAIACYTRSGFQSYIKTEPPTSYNDLDGQRVRKAYRIELGGDWTSQQLRYVFDWISTCPDSIRIFDASIASGSGKMDYSFAFKNCSNLTSVKMPSAQTVDHANSICENCSKLVEANLGWAKLSRGGQDLYAVFLNSAFRNCSSLEYVTLPSVPTDEPIKADSTFYGCSKLKRVNYLERLSNYFSLSYCFYGCSSLEYLELGADVSGLRTGWCDKTFDGVPDALIKWLPENCPDVPDAWKNYKNFVLPLHITLTGTLQAIRYTTNFTQGLSAGAVYTIGPAYAYVPSGDSNFAVGVYPNSNPSSSAVFPNATEIVSNYAGNGSYVNVWRYNGNDWYSSNLIPVRMNDTWSIKVKATRDLGVFEAPLGLRLIKGDGRYWYGTRDVLDFNDASVNGSLTVAGWLNQVSEIEGNGTWNDNMVRHLRWAMSGEGYQSCNRVPDVEILDLSSVSFESTPTPPQNHDIWSPYYIAGGEINPTFSGKLTAKFDSLCFVVNDNYGFKHLQTVSLPYRYVKPADYAYDINTTEVSLRNTFTNCTALTAVYNLDKITYLYDLGRTFMNCQSLVEADLSGLYQKEGRGPWCMEESFRGCTNLHDVILGRISSLASYERGNKRNCSMRGMFRDCPNLEYVQLFDLDWDYLSLKDYDLTRLDKTWEGSDQCVKFVHGNLDSEVPQVWKDQGYHNFVIAPLQVDIKGYNYNHELNDYVLHINYDSNLYGRYEYTVSPSYAWAEPHLRIEDVNHNTFDADAYTPTPAACNRGWLVLDVRDWYNDSYTDRVELINQATGIKEADGDGSAAGVKVWAEPNRLVIDNPAGYRLLLTDLQGRTVMQSSEEGRIQWPTASGVYLLQNLNRATTQKVLVP